MMAMLKMGFRAALTAGLATTGVAASVAGVWEASVSDGVGMVGELLKA
jgi:hypothetical protein